MAELFIHLKRESKMSLKKYQSHKIVYAKPMSRGAYNKYKGWTIPKDENPEDEWYLVVYSKDTKDHYESWSPKRQFDEGNSPLQDLSFDFGSAIRIMKAGAKVARKGWNGKGMWLILVPGSKNIKPVAGTPYSNAGLTEEIEILPHIDMYTVNSEGRRAMLPGWLASQTDMLSDDWVIVD